MSDNKPQQGEFCWNELMTPNAQKAKEFYGSLLNWQAHDIDMGEFTYTMLKRGDKDIAGMMQIPQGQEGQIPPHWMSYINVENLDEVIAKAKQLGASITVENQQVGDFGKFAVIQDPTGAHVALWQSLKES